MSSLAPITTESQVQAAIRGFLISILPDGVEVVEGQDQAVPEPQGSRYVVMTPVGRPRLATNLVVYADAEVTGSIRGSVLTVTHTRFGSVALGSTLWGVRGDVLPGTTIQSVLEGGVYQLAGPLQMVASETMACGNVQVTTDVELIIQLDLYGGNVRESTDMVGVVSALMRDEYATHYFDQLGIGVSPLHADEPRQVPFQNAESAWESRWSLDAHFQVNQVVTIPQQYMTDVQVTILPAVA